METESHLYAKGREFTVRRKLPSGPGSATIAPAGSGLNSHSRSPSIVSTNSNSERRPVVTDDDVHSNNGSLHSHPSNSSNHSKQSMLSKASSLLFGSGEVKDLQLRCTDAEVC